MILGHVISCLFYKGYVYDGYLYGLALQLIEDACHIDLAMLTIEEKETIIKQLESIHNYDVLHNDIARGNTVATKRYASPNFFVFLVNILLGPALE